MLRTGGIGRDVRQVHFGLLAGGKLDLGLLGRFLQTLHRQGVALQRDAVLLPELLGEVVDQAHVEILATEEGIPVGRENLELLLAVDIGDFDDRDVEGTTPEVIDRDQVVARTLVHAEGERRGGGLVDDALHVETRDATGILGGLALRIVEVRGYRDDCLGHRLAKVILGGLLHLLQDLRGDLRRRHFLALGRDPGVTIVGLDDLVRHHVNVLLHHVVGETPAHQALDRVQGVLGIRDRLTLGRLPDQHFAIVAVGNHGRRGARSLGILDDLRLAAFHDRHAGVGGPEVDTDNLAHFASPFTRRAGRPQ